MLLIKLNDFDVSLGPVPCSSSRNILKCPRAELKNTAEQRSRPAVRRPGQEQHFPRIDGHGRQQIRVEGVGVVSFNRTEPRVAVRIGRPHILNRAFPIMAGQGPFSQKT